MSAPKTYICAECAQKLGWRWPEGHIATFHRGQCDWCGEEKDLCNKRNWIQEGERK